MVKYYWQGYDVPKHKYKTTTRLMKISFDSLEQREAEDNLDIYFVEGSELLRPCSIQNLQLKGFP